MTLYREHDGGLIDSSELFTAKFGRESTNEDRLPRHEIWGEWYCRSEDCHVREVQIHAKWEEGNRPKMPKFKCPSCGGSLSFHHHLEPITLVPVEEK